MTSLSKEQTDEYKKDASKLIKDAKNPKNSNIILLSEKNKKRWQDNNNVIEDGWLNLYTSLGTAKDKTKYTQFVGFTYLDDRTLAELLVGDGFAQKISKVPANDMTREWIDIENDTEHILEDKLDSLKANVEFNQALLWKRHFGGSIIVMGINDGGDLWEPVNPNTIKSVDWLRTYDRTDISLTSINFMDNPNSERYAKPEFYTVTPKYSSPFNVHWSRVLEFKGLPTPNRLDSGNFWYWGMSVLQPIWNQIKDLASAERNVAKLLYEFVIGKYKIKGLAKLMSENSWEKIKQMIDTIDLGKSMINALLLDADGDDFNRDSANVSGLPEVMDRYMMFLAGVSNIPVTKLFGRSPAGQNATGESDEKNYYAEIRYMQKNDLVPSLQMLVDYINISKEISKKVLSPRVTPRPLFQETQEQIMANRKIQAEMDNIYINLGVLSPDEVRTSRFEEGYSFDTRLEEGSMENLIVKVPENENNSNTKKPEEEKQEDNFIKKTIKRIRGY